MGLTEARRDGFGANKPHIDAQGYCGQPADSLIAVPNRWNCRLSQRPQVVAAVSTAGRFSGRIELMIEHLRQLGRELGLDAVGIAPATEEVRRVYPWARSVVCAAISYLPPERPVSNNAPRGWVARFARSVDYHVVLRAKLDKLANVLASAGARTEICVDTNPLPERKLAVLAGIAWRGWNGCVFVEGCGSWVALGEVVTDLDLPAASVVEADRCGDCRDCIEACPTGAITAPYIVDRSRCLSHITQAGGVISDGMKAKLGDRIYGCDTCQEVCPQNGEVVPTTPEFAEDVFPGANPELMPLIELSKAEFDDRVRHSSIGWIGRNRIRRNAAIALGNVKRQPAPLLSS